MMCLSTFKKKSRIDFISFDEWVLFVNDNIKIALIKSEKFDWLGKCIPSDLPSEHPYYKFLANKELKRSISFHKNNLEICVKDNSKIKYFYNLDTTLSCIEAKIKKLESRIHTDI